MFLLILQINFDKYYGLAISSIQDGRLHVYKNEWWSKGVYHNMYELYKE